MADLIQRFQETAARLDEVVFSNMNATFELLPKPVVTLIAVLSVVIALAFGQRIVRGLRRNSAPVFEGIPFIGGLIKFARGPMLLMADGYKKCGEVFTVPLLHKNVTFLIGPATAPHFFKANDDEMSQTEVYKFNVPTFGPGVVFDVDVRIRTEQIRFFAEGLKTQKLKSYVPQFVMEAEDFFAKWGDEGVVDLQEQLTDLIIITASRTLLGREVREQLFDQVKGLLHDLDMGMQPISVLFPYLPTSFHRKRDSSRKELQRLFSGIIQQRRKSGVKEDDVLQVFIDSKYSKVYGGRATNDEEICGFLIAALFAGQHTSSITSSWTGYCMLNNKETLAPALEEQRQIMAKYGSELSLESLSEMDVLHRNIQEALRLFPPLILLMRYAKEAFSVTTSKGAAITIPKGNIVMTSPAFAQRLPDVFADPLEYQPDRYLAPREEDKAAPFSFIGFGGGRHACLGQNFAYLQIKTVWSVLLRTFELELVDPFPEPNYESMVVGPKACRIRYKRRTLV